MLLMMMEPNTLPLLGCCVLSFITGGIACYLLLTERRIHNKTSEEEPQAATQPQLQKRAATEEARVAKAEKQAPDDEEDEAEDEDEDEDEEDEDYDDDSDSDEEGADDYSGERYKMVLCVRSDLKMQAGKVAAQCGHAAVGAYKSAKKQSVEAVKRWALFGSPKIAVKIPDEATLMEVQRAASKAGVPYHIVADAGRTQVESGSLTVIAVGPGPQSKVDQVTGSFKLY
ncbi:aminoacyl-tRNA hydrolase [Balamuthia mandrillaris]